MRLNNNIIDDTVTLVLPDLQKVNIYLRTETTRISNFVLGSIISDYSSTSVKEKVLDFVRCVNHTGNAKPTCVKIPNRGIRLKILSSYFSICSLDANSAVWYSGVRYYNSSIVEITSPEICAMFPDHTIGVIMGRGVLLDLIIKCSQIDFGILGQNFYVSGFGQAGSCYQVEFKHWNDGNVCKNYGKLLKNSKFTNVNKLVPGRLYSCTRRSDSTLFIYLGEVTKDCFLTKSHRSSKHEFTPLDWGDNYFLCWTAVAPLQLDNISSFSCIYEIYPSEIEEIMRKIKGSDIVSQFLNENSNFFIPGQITLDVCPKGIELDDCNLFGISKRDDFTMILENLFKNVSIDDILKNNSATTLISLCPSLINSNKELKKRLIKHLFSRINHSSGRDNTFSYLVSNNYINQDELTKIVDEVSPPLYN